MFKTKIIPIPIYNGFFSLIVTDDVKKLNKALPGLDHEAEADIYAHAFDHAGKLRKTKKGAKWRARTTTIILNVNDPISSMTHGFIAHEIEHVKDYIFQYVNIGNAELEPQAYLVGWLTDQVYKWLAEMGELKKIKLTTLK